MCRPPHPSLPTSNSRVGNTISSGQWTERVHAWAGQWSGACPPPPSSSGAVHPGVEAYTPDGVLTRVATLPAQF